jgi:5-methyltetrahydropteroyltriglutamate--homocysteine methyltransferase
VFAREKLKEIKEIVKNGIGNLPKQMQKTYFFNKDINVQERIRNLTKEDFVREINFKERRIIQNNVLKLPLFPTTTIGSFPQTEGVRKKRLEYKNEKLTVKDYKDYIGNQIDTLIDLQEEIGLDVFVHGEFERTDMVEFFAQKLNGITTTESGWVISYGTRVYRPPIIFGDVSRLEPMTVNEINYAQSKTLKPVKGMLTGAVTIIAWSYCPESIPLSSIAYQIALALRDEIEDYENAGIKIVQVDEAAFREKAPVKKRDWNSYFDWAVNSFNLTVNVNPLTQIHTHMCYSDFGEIIEYIDKMDFDVISIEASRSNGDIIKSFEKINFEKQIGIGLWDIHSPVVPTVENMHTIAKRALEKIPEENFWLNPDCGLKTRNWYETKKALCNLVEVANRLKHKD